MEVGLSRRFATVTRKFGAGLRSIAKGALFGISVGLLSRLLNPLNELREKITGVLGEGANARDLAQKFNSKPGELLRLQAVAQSVGVKPEDLTETLNKFQESLETARRELNPNFEGEASAQSAALAQFVGNKDVVQSFISVMKSLRAEQNPARKSEFEKLILGSAQFGGMARLIGTDIDKQAARLGVSSSALGKSAANAASLSDLNTFNEAKRSSDNFLKQGGLLNNRMIQDINQAAIEEDLKITKQLQKDTYSALSYNAQGINKMVGLLEYLVSLVTDIAGGFGQMVLGIDNLTKRITNSWFFRNGGKE
jgi:hypothetical protein